jgi:EAL domain-containing protein (putative c-di-GMP-specific phosphodiesterase class I)
MTCQVVIDDFTLHSDVLPLLRSSAVRLVKIDAQLTAAAMKDKLSQAIVVAISQASKVLGTHCVAKRIDSAMARQWLAAVGVDFAQGFLLEGPLPLTDLVTLASKSQVQQV